MCKGALLIGLWDKPIGTAKLKALGLVIGEGTLFYQEAVFHICFFNHVKMMTALCKLLLCQLCLSNDTTNCSNKA